MKKKRDRRKGKYGGRVKIFVPDGLIYEQVDGCTLNMLIFSSRNLIG